MGNTIFIQEKKSLYQTIKNQTGSHTTIKTTEDCKSFAGVVNYLSMFCPNLQNFLKCINDLTRNERPFIWTKVHQEAFEETEARILKSPAF